MAKDMTDEEWQAMVDEANTYPHLAEIALFALVSNESNPNEQDERTFNALCASIEEEGWVQPMASVVQVTDRTYEIVAGHHRVEAARVLGYRGGPCWVLDPEKFDADRRDWNVVKQNIVTGKLNPVKFAQMFDRLKATYDTEVLKSLMGFTTSDAFDRLYGGVKRALPPDLQKALDEVKDEIRTIDDLSLVLNRLFAEYGETLPSNVMAFTWGGREVVWVLCDDRLWKRVQSIKAEVLADGLNMATVLADRLMPPPLADRVEGDGDGS